MTDKVSAGSGLPYVRVDWRFITLISSMLIPGLMFAGASLLNYATINSRLAYVEEEVRAAKNHNERITTLEKLEGANESRLAKNEGRMETMIDTFQGINRDVFSTVSAVKAKVEDLQMILRPGPVFTPSPQISDLRNGAAGRTN